MKWLFILLLLINIIYFGWEIDRNARFSPLDSAEMITIPANTAHLKLLSELNPLPEKQSLVAVATELEKNIAPLEPIIAINLQPRTALLPDHFIGNATRSDSDSVASRSPVLAKEICYTYGPVSGLEGASLLSAWFDEHDITYYARRADQQDKPLFWVYLPPQESREAALLVLSELKKRRIGKSQLIEQGPFLNGISLGLLSQLDVNNRLIEMKAAGYEPLVALDQGLQWFDVRVVASDAARLLTELPSQFKGVPVDCNNIAMNHGKS